MSLADAIIDENIMAVQSYLQSTRDINSLDEYGFTYLIEAAIADNVEIAELLLRYGANVNLQDMTGNTALHWATENNNVTLAQLLLQNNANANSYNAAGQPPLVMPLLRKHDKIKNLLLKHGADLQFAQDYINTKLLGHMFELVGTANIISPKNEFVEIDFEGFYLEVTLAIITHSLMEFVNHFGGRKVRRYRQYSRIIIEVLNRASQLTKFLQYRTDIAAQQTQINSLLDLEPLLLPIGYEGHAITFIKFGTLLAKCDRREDSRLFDNIAIYQITKPNRFTPTFLQDFIFEKKTDEFINNTLPEYLGLKPLTELKIEAQVSGNCSWANVEAAIPTIFFLLSLQSEDEAESLLEKKQKALHYFHQWRKWNKQRALQLCVQHFAGGDTLRNVCRAEILAAILYQRCNPPSTENLEAIDIILSVLTQPKFQHVLENYIKTYCYEGYSTEGKEFLKLLKSQGVIR